MVSCRPPLLNYWGPAPSPLPPPPPRTPFFLRLGHQLWSVLQLQTQEDNLFCILHCLYPLFPFVVSLLSCHGIFIVKGSYGNLIDLNEKRLFTVSRFIDLAEISYKVCSTFASINNFCMIFMCGYIHTYIKHQRIVKNRRDIDYIKRVFQYFSPDRHDDGQLLHSYLGKTGHLLAIPQAIRRYDYIYIYNIIYIYIYIFEQPEAHIGNYRVYSGTMCIRSSMARTPMARLPRLFRTRS